MPTENSIFTAIYRWASLHPRPDDPVVTTGMGTYTPRQMAHELRQESPAGKFFLRVVENSARHRSIEAVLDSFDRVVTR